MGSPTTERARWIAGQVLPNEANLRRWLGRRRGAGLEIDDIVQESYAILCSLESVEHIHNPKSYLFQTAYSVILRQVRRTKIVSIQTQENLDRLGTRITGPSPEQSTIDRDTLDRLGKTIAALPGKTREAFILRRVEGLSQREIARRMGISENTVEKHISRGLRILVSQLTRDGDAPGGRHQAKG